jgi:hypothetical protein
MTVKRWSKEDENFLMNSYSKLNNNELADHFGVSKIAIQRKLARLKLLRQYQKKWSEREEKFLFENYTTMSDRELAKVFSVTQISIKRKLARLGCRRNLRQKRRNSEVKLKTKKSGGSKIISDPQSGPPDFLINKAPAPAGGRKAPVSSNYKSSKSSKTLKTITRQIPEAPAAAASKAPRAAAAVETLSEAAGAGSEAPVNGEKQYCCSKSYEIGEFIYHKTWNDSGRVVKLIKTSGGHKAIVVEFSRGGQKILLSEVCETDTA